MALAKKGIRIGRRRARVSMSRNRIGRISQICNIRSYIIVIPVLAFLRFFLVF